MSKEPIVSFIVPVYKKPVEVFRRCLEGLFDKSVPKNIEVFAVFDGEDAALQAVAAEFPSVKSIVIQHGGAPKARNAGMDLAKGEYLWFVDADCYLKTGHVARMLEEFTARPDADFVYSGYEGTEGSGEFASESFSPYSLTCGNYISSMAPIKRAKAPRWDETLEAAQDWDFWLTAVANGCKGAFVEGSGFIADTPNSGITSVGWSAENRENTMEKIRRKHGIPDRTIGVFSMNYRERALKLAEILDADLIKSTGRNPSVYKVILNIGYGFMSRFAGIPEETVKIQYWVPGEIEALKDAKYSTVLETIRIAKGVINYCNTEYEKNRLAELGIEAEVVPLPLAKEDMANVSKELPEKFCVLVATDKSYADLLKDLSIDLPHVKFIYNAAKVTEFSCFLSFYQFAALDNAILIAQVNGRHVISNVQAPYCGFVDPELTWEEFKKQLYTELRNVRSKPINLAAQAYYLGESDPERFRLAITALAQTPLEVIS